jgi:carbonic anhydrase/acetyltransferase-like protein (isoleucine patch superfamily)
VTHIRLFAGKQPQLHPSVWIDPTALVIGEVVMDEDSSVWPMAVLRGDVQSIRVGKGCNIQDGAILHVSHDSRYCPGGQPLVLGDGITVGHQAVLHACEVGDHCLVGIGARVLDGAIIGARSILGAGALVPPGKRLEGGGLWVGAPAKRVRDLSEEELGYLEYSAAHYVKLAKQHRHSVEAPISNLNPPSWQTG